jgi:hypothetical protein
VIRSLARFVKFMGRSPGWRKVRAAHLKLYPTCAACGGIEDLEAHHLVPVSVDASLELDPNNLLTLCDSPKRLCHLRIGHSFFWPAFNPFAAEDAARSLCRIQQRVKGKVTS